MDPLTKICSKCQESHPIDQFSVTRKTATNQYRHNLCRICMNNAIREKRIDKTPLVKKGFEKLPEETQTYLKENIKLRKYTLKQLADNAGIPYGNLLYFKRKGKLPE